MHPALALDISITVLLIVAIASALILVLIVATPFPRVRDEPPLDPAVEAKLLLRRDPDEPTGEIPPADDLDEASGDAARTLGDESANPDPLAELRDLDGT
ncbi:MAG TPA: hypothetical protein VGA11_01675 [Acidimicrobiia bacterium]